MATAPKGVKLKRFMMIAAQVRLANRCPLSDRTPVTLCALWL